jgi:hypothetical protein
MKGLALLLGLLQAAGGRGQWLTTGLCMGLIPQHHLPLTSPLSLQLGLLNLRQPLLQTLLGTDLSLQR